MSIAGIHERSDVHGTVPTTLRVNGVEHELRIDPRVSLLDVLREHLGLTGIKKGCDQGACGGQAPVACSRSQEGGNDEGCCYRSSGCRRRCSISRISWTNISTLSMHGSSFFSTY